VGCFAKPLDGLGVVLCHASASAITPAEAVFSPGIALVGCFAIPLERLGIVPSHAQASFITPAETILCLCISLACCFTIPLDRLGIILRHALTFGVAFGQLGLSFSISALRFCFDLKS